MDELTTPNQVGLQWETHGEFVYMYIRIYAKTLEIDTKIVNIILLALQYFTVFPKFMQLHVDLVLVSAFNASSLTTLKIIRARGEKSIWSHCSHCILELKIFLIAFHLVRKNFSI